MKMNIIELVKNQGGGVLMVSAEDLAEFGKNLIEETLKQQQEEKKERLLTAKQFTKLHQISMPTLWRWEKNCLVEVKKIGSKKFYKEIGRADE